MALYFLALVWILYIMLGVSLHKRPQYTLRAGGCSLAVVFSMPVPIVCTAVYLALYFA